MSLIMLVAAIGAVMVLYTEDFERAEKMFERGEYVSAFQIYLDLAQAGDHRAQFAVGKIYEVGLGPNIYDPDLAISYLRQSAAGGYGPARMELADAYFTGERWFNQDFIQAESWWGRASENNLFEAWYRLKALYPVFGRRAEGQLTVMEDNAFRLLNLAEEGEVYAMVLTGYFYMLGGGLDQDLGAARAWFERASATGNPFASYGLAQLLEAEGGDPARIAALVVKAAQMGHTEAQLHLANLYETGTGIGKSDQQALFWSFVVLRQNVMEVPDREELMARRLAPFDRAAANILRQEANEWRARGQPIFILGAQEMEF
jgi:uncharacterized protein